MSLEEKTIDEYLLLRNYRENSLYARGLLLRIAYVTLKQIESDSWPGKLHGTGSTEPVRFSDSEKRKVRATIQIDIISKIMMYIEDIAVLAESFRQEKSFYDFLDAENKEQDLGSVIEQFFKNIESYSDSDLFKIMSYVEPDETKLDKECIDLLKKHLKTNIEEVRRILKQIGDFGRTNHIIFKRFKHAGFPIILDGVGEFTGQNPLEGFDSYMLTSKGTHAIRDVVPIPYSKDVLEGYELIIKGIQTLLIDMIDNRIASIERGVRGIIVPESYAFPPPSQEELRLIDEKARKYFEMNPLIDLSTHFKFNRELSKEDIKWYWTLPEFLESCRKRK